MSKKMQNDPEYARQIKTLNGLPKGFKYPLFNGWQAVQSQRKSGYKTTARAAREIVDNSIEAGAQNVWIVFDMVKEKDLKPNQRKNTVTAIAFIDDGPGMIHASDERSILRYALSWGGGTHFDEHNFIGKFGFGLPNSSVNQTQFTEVFTRTTNDKDWNSAALDIRREAVPESGEVRAGKVVEKPLPKFVQEFLDNKGIKLKTGSVVVWWNPDRLTVNTRASLREHLEHDFQIVYRGLLDRVKLYVDSDEPVFRVDPTFLEPAGYLYEPPEKGGAECMYDNTLMVKHYRDETSGQPRLELVGPEKGRDPVTGFTFDLSLEEAKKHQASPVPGQREVGLSTIRVRVSYLPYPTFMRKEKGKAETELGRRFNIRKRTRGMSFVRSGREIDTVDAFPKVDREETGHWPLLEAYAYYWAAEVQFDPGLDDALGIGHDKQTVEPIAEFWKVLSKARVNDALARATAKRKVQGEDFNQKKQLQPDADLPSVTAADQATRIDHPAQPGSGKMKAIQAEVQAAEDASAGGSSSQATDPATESPNSDAVSETEHQNDERRDKVRPQSVGGVSEGRFAIEFFEAEGGVFMQPRPGPNGRVEVWINRKHPWYEAYANPRSVLESRNATNLLLLALAAAEIRASDEKQALLEDVRCDDITPFLRKTVRVLKAVLPQAGEEADEEPVAVER